VPKADADGIETSATSNIHLSLYHLACPLVGPRLG
jgi:hypothetical protein